MAVLRMVLGVMLLAVSCLAVLAETATPPPVTVSVRYTDDGAGPLTLVFTNHAADAVELSGMQQMDITERNGMQATAYPSIDPVLPGQVTIFSKMTLQGRETRELGFDPQHYRMLDPETPYRISCQWTWSTTDAQGTHGGKLQFVCPFITPALSPTPTFTSVWRLDTFPGLACRLAVTLYPVAQRGDVTVEYRNVGQQPIELHAEQYIQATVHTTLGGQQVHPEKFVELAPPVLTPLSLPAGAAISLPMVNYGEQPKPNQGAISLWLGTEQYLLYPGTMYTVDATVIEPGGDRIGSKKTMLQLHILVPK